MIDNEKEQNKNIWDEYLSETNFWSKGLMKPEVSREGVLIAPEWIRENPQEAEALIKWLKFNIDKKNDR